MVMTEEEVTEFTEFTTQKGGGKRTTKAAEKSGTKKAPKKSKSVV